MLTSREALDIVKSVMPKAKIESYIEYRNLFIYQMIIDDPYEGGWDPFYSVNRDTKEFKEFSIMLDGDLTEVNDRFVAVKRRMGK